MNNYIKYSQDYVEVDFDNLFKIAYDEMISNQFEEAEKHFDMYVLKNPNEWKAQFYRAYCKCHEGKIGEIPRQAQIFESAFKAAYEKIKVKENQEEKEAGLKIILTFLNEQASYFTSNGQRVGGIFGSASVGASTVGASNRMLDNCIKLVEKDCSNNEELDALIKSLRKTHRTGLTAILIIIFIAVIIGIVTFFWIYGDLLFLDL